MLVTSYWFPCDNLKTTKKVVIDKWEYNCENWTEINKKNEIENIVNIKIREIVLRRSKNIEKTFREDKHENWPIFAKEKKNPE